MSIKDLLHFALVSVLAIASGLVFAPLYSVFTPSDTRLQTIETFKEPRQSSTRVEHLTTSGVFDSETFYQTIIDNNLFRPLGWTPPRPKEPYRLIGTVLPRSANTPPKAIIETTAGNQTHIVSPGEQIDASTEVVSIEGKAVTLSTEGQQRTLRLRSGF